MVHDRSISLGNTFRRTLEKDNDLDKNAVTNK